MQCYACNSPLRPAARFCPACGRPALLNDRYRVVQRLGQGGFAVVYEAHDVRLNRRCAIKAIPVATPDEQRQAESEARILGAHASRLDFIPDIYDIWSGSGHIYLVMEYVDGVTLAEIGGRWPPADVEAFVRVMLSALIRLHAAGIIHRDLKPENIKRTSQGAYVLLDFGIAKQGAATLRIAKAVSLEYAPIEQLRGQTTDPRTDLYSLAATAYFLLTGRPPARADERLLNSVSLDPPGRLAPQISPAFEELLLRMLAVEADHRPASAQEALDLLDAPPTSSAGQATTRLPDPLAPTTAERIFVVAQDGSGDYTTISEAIAAAAPGTRILVRPGYYEEGIKLDRNVELVGDGPRAEVVVANAQGDALIVSCKEATVRGLSLRCIAGPNTQFFGVDIPQGQVLLEECDISSDSLACVGVHGPNAAPTLRRCRIFGGHQGGFYAYALAGGLLEECEIFDNTYSGVELTGGATTTVRRCIIRDGKQSGVYIWSNAEGLIEDCQITGNAFSNVSIKQGGHPTIRRCVMSDAKQSGLYVYDHGGGVIEECEIFGNTYAGIAVKQSADPTVRNCTVRNNRESGVYVYEQGRGLFEICEVYANGLAGFSIAEESNPTVRACKIYDGKSSGVNCYERGMGVIEECEIFDNAYAGVSISKGSTPIVLKCRIHSGKQGGVLGYEEGLGVIEECDIFANTYAGVEIREGSATLVRRCRIYDNRTNGAQISYGGIGVLEECDLVDNTLAGVQIKREGNPTVRRCTIRRNRENGLTVDPQGGGTFEECEITDNGLAGAELRGASGTSLRRCKLNRNRFQAVYAHEKAEALVTDCDLTGNGRGPWLVAGGALVQRGSNRE